MIIDAQTEWLETINEGWNTIAGPRTEKIRSLINSRYRPTLHTNALGDGVCGPRIVQHIIHYLDHQTNH